MPTTREFLLLASYCDGDKGEDCTVQWVDDVLLEANREAANDAPDADGETEPGGADKTRIAKRGDLPARPIGEMVHDYFRTVEMANSGIGDSEGLMRQVERLWGAIASGKPATLLDCAEMMRFARQVIETFAGNMSDGTIDECGPADVHKICGCVQEYLQRLEAPAARSRTAAGDPDEAIYELAARVEAADARHAAADRATEADMDEDARALGRLLAERAMMSAHACLARTPAHSLQGLIRKLDTIWTADEWDADAEHRTLRADLWRLTGPPKQGTGSPLFRAQRRD